MQRNAVIYCRVSSKEQTEGTSLDSQRIACEEYARTHKLDVLRTFIEQGESAKFADRTQLLELIAFCEQRKGAVNMLLVWKVDRFARNVADHFSVKATLSKAGVRIVSVTEPIDTNPEGKLMETILAGFAQFDNDIRAMRTVQGMRRKIQEGIFPWRPPLGYRSAGSEGERKNAPDEPDQPLFGLLQKAWHEFATGAHTKAEMRRLMNQWGIVTRRDRPLSPQSVDNLFCNPYYAGILIDPWSREEVVGLHSPMITKQVFAAVQYVMAKRGTTRQRRTKVRDDLPLRGLVRCSGCTAYLTASFSKGQFRRYAYYHCYNKSCAVRGKGISAKRVHEEFEAFLRTIAPKRELLERLGEKICERAAEERQMRSVRKARSRAMLDKLADELRELISMRTQNLISDHDFQQYHSTLLKRRYALEKAVAPQANVTADAIRKKLSEIIDPLEALFETWQSLPTGYRAQFQRVVVPVGFTAGSIRTAELGLLFALKDGFRPSDSHEVTLTPQSWNGICREIVDLSMILSAAQEQIAA